MRSGLMAAGAALWMGVAGLVALGAAGPLACGGDERTVRTDEGEVTVTREGEGVHIRSEEEGFEGRFGPGAELPDGFPEDVPLPPDAEVMGSMVSPEDGAIVSLRSDAAPEELATSMREGLAGQGWSVEEQTNVMGQRILPATKEGRRLVVQISEREGRSQVMVHVAAPEGGEGS